MNILNMWFVIVFKHLLTQNKREIQKYVAPGITKYAVLSSQFLPRPCEYETGEAPNKDITYHIELQRADIICERVALPSCPYTNNCWERGTSASWAHDGKRYSCAKAHTLQLVVVRLYHVIEEAKQICPWVIAEDNNLVFSHWRLQTRRPSMLDSKPLQKNRNWKM